MGELNEGGTCRQRLRALMDLNHDVLQIDTFPASVARKSRSLIQRVRTKLFGRPDLAGVNLQIRNAAKEFKADVLWIDKGLTITIKTMENVRSLLPSCKFVGYSPDDMYAPHNQSRHFKKSLKMYDLYFTTKSYGVAELKSMGALTVIFLQNAFCLYTHRPMQVTKIDRERFGGPVGFVGTFEKDRAASVHKLARNEVSIRIWGNGWGRERLRYSNLNIMGRAIYGDDYATALCAFDINLCFLRKINRDLQTTRSIEIPACGAFMLAERTDEHLSLFEEGKEAEFFETDEELLDKVRYYLRHVDQRKRIADAGRERCIKSGYSYHDRIKDMMHHIKCLL